MKYMGSKNRIANHILPIMLEYKKEYDWYVEPFCGGLGTMDKVEGIKRIANDYNPFLIAMWLGLQSNLEKPMEIPKVLYNEYREKYNAIKKNDKDFVRTRELLNNNINKELFLIGWVGYMGSFNGRFYDGGYSGKTDKRDYVDEQIRNTTKQINLIEDITFCTYSFEYLDIPPRSIIYCDIPYKNTKQYAFSTNFDYTNFYEWCRKIALRGDCKIFISEYEIPQDFKCIWQMEVTNAMATKNTYKPIERLFTI